MDYDFNRDIHKKAAEADDDLASGLSGLPLRITTITVGVYMNDGINLDRLVEEIEDPENIVLKAFIAEIMGPMKRSGKRNFNNSVVFKLPDGKLQQAVKIFCNGSLHITGYKSVKRALEISDMFSTLFELVQGGSGIEGRYVISRFDIQLVNLCCVHPMVKADQGIRKINLQSFHKILKKYSDFYVTFDTDRYAGVVMKAPRFTIMVFESGSIIVTSVRKGVDIRDAYAYIDAIFQQHIHEFMGNVEDAGNDCNDDKAVKHYTLLK